MMVFASSLHQCVTASRYLEGHRQALNESYIYEQHTDNDGPLNLL